MKKVKNILFAIVPIVSIVVLFFSYGLLFIPFSGVAFYGGVKPTFDYWVSAFVAFFPHVQQFFYDNVAAKDGVNCSAAGIVILSSMLLSLICLVVTVVVWLLAKLKKQKSEVESFYKLLAGIFVTFTGVMLNSLQLWMVVKYKTTQPVVLWCPYISGTLLVICGGLLLWGAIDALVREKNAPLEQKSYSYLKKK